MQNKSKYINNSEYVIMLFIFLLLFALPAVFTRINGETDWRYVTKLWKDQFLIIPLFIINHWLLVPKILFKKKYIYYLISTIFIITIFTFSYYYYDEIWNKNIQLQQDILTKKRPPPIPPFANLLTYSLLIIGIDTGLLYIKKWHNDEDKKHILEQQNIEMQLEILRNQISPHFFMNTLNNIHALIDYNKEIAKNSVIKLSKLMRVLLYENHNYTLQKEIEFINDYIELMKIRVTQNVEIKFEYPTQIPPINIPPLLFINFIENSFKHGIIAVGKSFIYILFQFDNKYIYVKVLNHKPPKNNNQSQNQHIGIINSKRRLDLIYQNNYTFEITETNTIYEINIKIPIYENKMFSN